MSLREEMATAAPKRSPGRPSGGRITVAACGSAPVEPNSRKTSPVPLRPGAPATVSAQESRRSSSPVASAAPKRSPATGAPAPGTRASVIVRGVTAALADDDRARRRQRAGRPLGHTGEHVLRPDAGHRAEARLVAGAGRGGGRGGGRHQEHGQQRGEQKARHPGQC